MRMLRLMSFALVVAALVAPPAVAFAASPYCSAGELPVFRYGFAALQVQLGAGMGTPIECEHADAGDTSYQATTTGLAFYSRRTGVTMFTSIFGGKPYANFALTPDGLLFWQGEGIEPPPNAPLVSTALCAALPADTTDGRPCLILYIVQKGDPFEGLNLNSPSPSAPGPTAGTDTILPGSLSSPGLPVSPPAPTPPSDRDLRIVGLSVGGSSRSFPQVDGRLCNDATEWRAQDVRLEFEFYYDSPSPTLDSGSKYVSSVDPGDCARFSATLTALSPWRTIRLKRATWTWTPT